MSPLRLLLAFLLGFALASSQTAAAQQLQQRDRYLLHSGDQLTIDYTFTPEFNNTATVHPDGFLTLKVGGDVQVAGKTLAEVKTLIEQSASSRLKDPQVTLTLTDFQHPYFVVAGEAYAPLKYELRDTLTVLQGLMIAGGIKQTGKEKQVVVIRGANSPSPEIHVLDLKKVQSQAIFEHDLPLQSGDIIYIPRSKLTHAAQIVSLINSPATYGNILVYGFR